MNTTSSETTPSIREKGAEMSQSVKPAETPKPKDAQAQGVLDTIKIGQGKDARGIMEMFFKTGKDKPQIEYKQNASTDNSKNQDTLDTKAAASVKPLAEAKSSRQPDEVTKLDTVQVEPSVPKPSQEQQTETKTTQTAPEQTTPTAEATSPPQTAETPNAEQANVKLPVTEQALQNDERTRAENYKKNLKAWVQGKLGKAKSGQPKPPPVSETPNADTTRVEKPVTESAQQLADRKAKWVKDKNAELDMKKAARLATKNQSSGGERSQPVTAESSSPPPSGESPLPDTAKVEHPAPEQPQVQAIEPTTKIEDKPATQATEAQPPAESAEKNELSQEQKQLNAMGEIGAQLADMKVSPDKRAEIIKKLSQNPDTIISTADTLKNIKPENISTEQNNLKQEINQLENKGDNLTPEEKNKLTLGKVLLFLLGAIAAAAIETTTKGTEELIKAELPQTQ